MKFSVSSKVKKFKPSKRHLVITAATIAILALLGLSMIVQVRHERAAKATDTARNNELSSLRTENTKLKKQNADLQAANQFQTAKSQTVCNSYKTLAAATRRPNVQLCQ